MPGAPRPLKLTPAVHDTIVASIGRGVPIATACRAAGVSDDSYRVWLKRGKDPNETDERFSCFSEAIARAEADAEAGLTVAVAEDEDWRAKAWVLSRRWKGRWSERQELTGADGQSLQVAHEHRGVPLSDVLELARKAGVALPPGPPDPPG